MSHLLSLSKKITILNKHLYHRFIWSVPDIFKMHSSKSNNSIFNHKDIYRITIYPNGFCDKIPLIKVELSKDNNNTTMSKTFEGNDMKSVMLDFQNFMSNIV
jgi:hypothetical protein